MSMSLIHRLISSWAIENGTSATQTSISLVNGYIVQPSRWIRNFGYMNVEGMYATDGGASGQLGYLIDNQASFLTVLAGSSSMEVLERP